MRHCLHIGPVVKSSSDERFLPGTGEIPDYTERESFVTLDLWFFYERSEPRNRGESKIARRSRRGGESKMGGWSLSLQDKIHSTAKSRSRAMHVWLVAIVKVYPREL